MDRPLQGVRVVEMGTHVAVPMATRLMAEWGAEVIKVEPPKGDDYRTMGKSYSMPYQEDYNVVYQLGNANKKSMVLNLKDPKAKDVLFKLLDTTDIVVTNTRQKGLVKLGLDYDALAERFPRIIYAHLSGFGQTGPDKDRPGYDVAAFWARSGALIEWALREDTPARPMGGMGDSTTGAMILAGVLAALYQREKTGKGDKLDLSLYGTALWYNSLGVLMGQEKFGHKYPKSRYEQILPTTPLYKTKDDDWFMISEWNWEGKADSLFELLRIPQYIGNPEYNTFAGAAKNMKQLVDILDAAMRQMPTQELLDGLAKLDIVHEKLANPAEITKDPQAWENNYLYEVTLPSGDTVVLPTPPVQFRNVVRMDFHHSPYLGQDTVAVLKQIGYSDAEIQALLDEQVALAHD